ncbi:MAG: RNA polymerase alpha chain family protein,sigma-70 family protein [Parcubacteria group bacterium GW2011_GWD1_42_9]|uniref:HTH HARE-type domain-containing protein n=1 Tax=Candidatus Veblenbacteria bacterium RIFOXYB1_FULL_43_13 TaxID=1802426 RepID=A0A1G2Q4X1_9BACT|nr:MAG: RNA polymerase alpha chain family protein,sigma-70 family protein [Parcubacteria group bacterium GW2011_GWD1_42_9]KKT17389.1 MAG: RNA polymerase alpha chain family protein,sigma-70 family protein [Parcubacteria group bacterium GW2011_GWB1_43_66]OHA55608.1 MAG: hypothetical protein A2388_02115 [Candidatus Veblenbacteria bacterium RIFOXYB1_FULL_43_13]HAO81554.1 hypothetical protein [Candidatus Veblenbacteria bacterium]
MSDDTTSILDQIIATQQVSHRENFKPRSALNLLLELLTERERQILWRRFGFGGEKTETLENIGKSFRVTRERIRQIERLAVAKLVNGQQAQTLLKPLKQVVVEILETEGGACTDERFIKLLSEVGDEANANISRFFMTEVLTDVVTHLGGENSVFLPGWRLRSASIEGLEKLVSCAEEIITDRGLPVTEEDLAQQLLAKKLLSPLQGVLAEPTVILNLLQLSAVIRRNTFGEWGLKHWETISPKRMNDKIYLVLKKHGKPMHFREIVRLINEQSFDHKKAYAPTVHNELILDDKFVLVGRGIYALKEWGYKPGVVADVMVEILKEHGQPIQRDELVAAVLKQRLVKRGTIYLALTNKKKFARLPDGRYSLANNETETKPAPTVI